MRASIRMTLSFVKIHFFFMKNHFFHGGSSAINAKESLSWKLFRYHGGRVSMNAEEFL